MTNLYFVGVPESVKKETIKQQKELRKKIKKESEEIIKSIETKKKKYNYKKYYKK